MTELKSFRLIQAEHQEWQHRNFGPQSSYLMLLGMIEEYGEMTEGLVFENHEGYVDGLGDLLVYSIGYATSHHWDFQELWDAKPVFTVGTYAGLTIALGRLAHSELKSLQNIRGTKEELKRKAKENFMMFLTELNSAVEHGHYCLSTLNQVWDKVSKRDWKANPEGIGY